MARQSLGDLLGNVGDRPAITPSGADAPEVEVLPRAQSTEVLAARSETPTARTAPIPAPPTEGETPLYLRFVRKETRLREDQQNQLTLQARRLNRAKVGGTPRITDNTLIRVAVDLLLGQIESAHGSSEAELLASVHSPRG